MSSSDHFDEQKGIIPSEFPPGTFETTSSYARDKVKYLPGPELSMTVFWRRKGAKPF